MKNIILFIALISFGFINSQVKIELTKDGIINAEQVILLDTISSKQIYKRANNYIQKNYVNPNQVRKGNIENEYISFNGIKKSCVKQKIMFSNFTYSLEYFFDVNIKDGKIKIRLNQATLIYDTEYRKLDMFTYGKSMNAFKSDGTVRNMYADLINNFNEQINLILNEFVLSLKGKDSQNNW
jgi:hypothetical protein